jgi:hypothetical protein
MRLLLLMTLLAGSSVAIAQPSAKDLAKHAEKVTKSREKGKNLVSLDTLFASGKPYCIMKGSKKILGGYGAYSVRPLGAPDNEEIYMEIESEGVGSTAVWFWNMVFINQGQKLRFRNGTLDLENTLVEYNLITETGLNVAGMNKLILLKGDKRTTQPSPVQNNNLVDRNRSGMIQVFGEKIQQSGVMIGLITKNVTAESGGVITRYSISLPTGEIVATARNHGATDHEWEITTAKDNKLHTLSSSIGHDEKDLAKFLVDLLYL